MLPRKERLSRAAFNRFFSMGKRIHTPSFLVVYAPEEALHVSVVVSKKVAKTSVARNKIRRRIYDIVRVYRKKHPVSGVYIFLTKAGIGTLPYAVLRDAVHAVLEKNT